MHQRDADKSSFQHLLMHGGKPLKEGGGLGGTVPSQDEDEQSNHVELHREENSC